MIELVFYLLVGLMPAGDYQCDPVEFAASAIASEGARQPLEAQVNIARAVRDNAPCGNPNYLSGYALALRTSDRHNHHFRSYFALHSFPKELQDRWRLAAFVAYTEQPRVPVRHFDRVGSTAYWWASTKACPNGIWVIGEIQFC